MTPPVVTPGRARAAIAAAVLAMAACGDDDGEATVSTPAPGADLTVEAHDNHFDRDEYRLAPGEQRVAYVQEGEVRHTLVVETAGGAAVEGFALEVDGLPSDAGTVDLEAGRYTLYCDVAGHRQAGMEADLAVG